MTVSTKNNFKLTLDNFQAIIKAELEFEQGINLICGESNSGKSAILRAIKNSIINPNKPQKYINYKADKLCTNIEYLNNSIKWEVNSKGAKYIVNGEDFIKVGRSNLLKVLERSGFVLSADNKLMNVESELELPFPFGLTSSELFKLFEKGIICTADSATIIKLMKEDENFNNKEKESTEIKKQTLENKLTAVETLEKEVDLNKLNSYRSSLKELAFRANKLNENYELVKRGAEANKQLKQCKSQPEVSNTLINDYEALLKDIKNIEKIISKCKILGQPVNSDIKVTNLNDLENLKEDYKKLFSILKKLKVLKIINNKPEVNDIYKDYMTLNKDYKTLYNIKQKLILLKGNLSKQKEKINEVKKKLSLFNVCPLCGQELKNEC